ncbi:MAG: EVE domain-containing protein [Phycisphaerales bacterium]|jgi:predicted RNA-binding protein with PUA-like domain
MATILLKTEPGEFSFADIERDGRCLWDGVSNAAALIALRQAREGDEALIYHTGDEKAIVGLAKVTRGAFEDPANPGVNDKGEPKFAVIELRAVRRAATPVSLAEIKADDIFAEFALVKQGRLSAMMVPPALDKALRKMAGL